MGLPAARIKDLCTGHGPYPPRPALTASTDVYVNSRGSHRKDDKWKKHCALTCHDSVTSTGSNTVFINGKAAARVQDEVECGSKIQTGSKNVFMG